MTKAPTPEAKAEETQASLLSLIRRYGFEIMFATKKQKRTRGESDATKRLLQHVLKREPTPQEVDSFIPG